MPTPSKSFRFGIRRVPTSALDQVAARAWSPGRFERVRLAYAQGVKLPPILVCVHGNGIMTLSDGNHRLAIAREVGAPTILVHLARGDPDGYPASDDVAQVETFPNYFASYAEAERRLRARAPCTCCPDVEGWFAEHFEGSLGEVASACNPTSGRSAADLTAFGGDRRELAAGLDDADIAAFQWACAISRGGAVTRASRPVFVPARLAIATTA